MIKLAYLIPLLPFLGFVVNGLLRKQVGKGGAGFIGSSTVLLSFLLSLGVFFQMKGQTEIVHLFDFIHVATLKIPFAFQLDALSSIFLLIITGVGFLIHVYSIAYMQEEKEEHFARYFAYLNLFVFSMLILVMGANYIVMFMGWEGVGLCSYLLIGYWFKNTAYNNAAKKAFVMNRIGDLGVLLAIFWMIQKFGNVDFSGEAGVLANAAKLSVNDPALVGITMLLFVGATGKSAQIPLYTWLPDAMAGPTPVSALIHAATMVTAGIYMIARSNILFTLAVTTSDVITVIGLATAILAATIALQQNDIKKVLAYSTISQLGFMFLALGTGNYIAAVFHVITHAFFKALMFLGAGSVIHANHHQQDMRYYGGLGKKMPITHFTFLIGCLAIAGIPGFSGFFSKDEILLGVFAHSSILYVLALGAALLTAFYMFRLYSMTFLGTYRGDSHHLPHESPSLMTVPLIVLAVLSLIGGYIGIPELFLHDANGLHKFLAPIFEVSAAHLDKHEIPHNIEWILLAVSTLLIIGVIYYAIQRFKKYQFSDEQPKGFAAFLANKWYVDELYQFIVIRPLLSFGSFLGTVIEKSGIDKLVNGVGKGIGYLSRQFRLLQSGNVGNYVLMMVIAIIGLIWLVFYIKL